jgi:hypothetical protein
MKKTKYLFIVLTTATALSLEACGNGGNESKGTDTTAMPAQPAPDNSDATNPSLADTTHYDTTASGDHDTSGQHK